MSANRFHVPIGIVSLVAPPDAPVTGETYFDTALGQLRSWDGTGWVGTSSDAGLDADFVNVPGDGMTGELVLPDQVVVPPSAPAVVAAKGYVDQLVTVSDVPPAAPPARDGLIWSVVEKAPVTPASVPGLGLWLDATQLALADGADVLVWPDLSEGGNDVSVRVGQDNPPTFRTNVVNGLPVVRFDLTQYEFLFGAAPIGQVAHVFVVCKFNAATFPSYNGVFTGGAEIFLLGDAGFSSLYLAGNSPTYYYNGANSDATRQGPMGEFAALGISLATAYPSVVPVVGVDRYIADRHWDGDIAEIVVYDHVLSDEDRQGIDGYLRDKWGL